MRVYYTKPIDIQKMVKVELSWWDSNNNTFEDDKNKIIP